MIVVWGCIETTEEHLQQVLTLSLEHVHRSRAEPGCISHSAQIDAETPNRVVFFEEWESMDALKTHFSVPASSEFVNQVARLSVSPPEIRAYAAEPVKLG